MPKLTIDQLNTLSIIFLFNEFRCLLPDNLDSFVEYLKKYLTNLVSSLSSESSFYKHIAYTGCGNVEILEFDIFKSILNSYKGIFCKGFSREEFDLYQLDWDKYVNIKLIIPCLSDSSKFQINAVEIISLETTLNSLGVVKVESDKLKQLFDKNNMDSEEIKNLLTQKYPEMKTLFDCWASSHLRNMSLTTVGMSLAIANIKRLTGEYNDLEIWIKD